MSACSYRSTLKGMSTDRVTVSLSSELRTAAQSLADEAGLPFSAVVSEALVTFVRGRMIDAWVAEHEERHGVITEAELVALAEETGIPYLAPRQNQSAA